MFNSFGRVAYIQIARQFTPETMKMLYANGITNVDLQWETIKGLDIKFDISRPIYSLQSEARISILGLSMKKIEQYASWGGEATMFKSATLIRVYAGYGDSDKDANLIFEGNIINAMPTMPPNVWLEIQARTMNINVMMSFTKDLMKEFGSKRTVALRNYVEQLCYLIGFDVDEINFPIDHVDDIITTPVYEKPTTFRDVLRDLRKVCESKNIIFDIMIQQNGKPILIVEPRIHPDDFTPSESECVKINKDTGMIGIPKMKFNQIEVTCLLNQNTTSSLLKYADVSSRFAFPGLYNWKGDKTDDIYHALFRITNIKYHGHLRGNEWYATYTAQRDWQEGDR